MRETHRIGIAPRCIGGPRGVTEEGAEDSKWLVCIGDVAQSSAFLVPNGDTFTGDDVAESCQSGDEAGLPVIPVLA
jgi:hypothetical protein